MKVKVVLISPETAGNIGAIARSMANFDCKELIIINPETDHLCKEALDRASHAKKILKSAKVINESNIDKIKNFIRSKGNHVIATTSKLGKDYNILRSVEYVDKIAERFSRKDSDIVLLFGRESNGLTNEELEIADFSVTIPASDKYSVMNLSHAVNVCLYEFYKNNNHNKLKNKIPKQAQSSELKQLKKLINKTIDDMTFFRDSQERTQRLVWNKLISKLMLTKREAFALMGYFKKILKKR
jgi:TrmH family RNA methyltransferase